MVLLGCENPTVIWFKWFHIHDGAEDSQYLPQRGDLSVHHLFLLHRVSIQLQQVSLPEKRAQAHHLLIPARRKIWGDYLLDFSRYLVNQSPACFLNPFDFLPVPVVLDLVLDLREDQLLQLRQGSSDVLLSVKPTLWKWRKNGRAVTHPTKHPTER